MDERCSWGRHLAAASPSLHGSRFMVSARSSSLPVLPGPLAREIAPRQRLTCEAVLARYIGYLRQTRPAKNEDESCPELLHQGFT